MDHMPEGWGISHWDQGQDQIIPEVNSEKSPITPGAKAWKQRESCCKNDLLKRGVTLTLVH